MYNKMQSYVYCNFVKQTYQNVSEIEIINIEEVYYKNNKLVVFVKNEEVGEQLYEIITTLTNRKDIIEAEDISFQIDKYYADKQKIVKWFCINLKFKNSCLLFSVDKMSKLEKLLRLVSFIYDMKSHGYILEESRFQSKKCKSIANFLTSFVFNDEKVTNYEEGKLIEDFNNTRVSNLEGCIIRHIHYSLSNGGNFDEFYKRITENNVIWNISEFPYALPIIKLCYKYYSTGIIDNIHDVIKEEIEEEHENNYYEGYFIADRNILKTNLSVIHKNTEFTIYDGNIKIYNQMTSDFKEFLKHNNSLLTHLQILLETNIQIIIDFDKEIIGYTYKTQEVSNSKKILEETFYNQSDIFDFIYSIHGTLLKTLNTFSNSGYLHIYDNFNLEEAIIGYKVKNVNDLFNLVTNRIELLDQKITVLFFKLLFKYLIEKYGEIHNEEQFLEKIEVRYLSPIIAREFINFALVRRVNYNQATKEFARFLYSNFLDEDLGCRFDNRLFSNPDYAGGFPSIFDIGQGQNVLDGHMKYRKKTASSFLFDYEVEKKYGITICKDFQDILDDGRKLVIFKRGKNAKKTQKFYDKEISLNEEIESKIGDIEDGNIEIVGISELIYSTKINEDNTYELIGYISSSINGRLLTDDVLLSLNNKQMLKVFAYLFTKFGKYYIPWESIWMDDNFTFYIDIFNKDFKVKRCSVSNGNFIEWIIEYLYHNGYNRNAFANYEFEELMNFPLYRIKNYLLEEVNGFDTYCNEHKIFYNSKNTMCPVCLKTKYLLESNFEESADKIFEDSIATHYRINSRYNLKIYKQNVIDIEAIQNNINNIIDSQLNSEKIQLGQDCFIPYKKALNNNLEFVGYIYEAVEFGEGINDCIDIKNSQKLKNLPRLMSLIRLLLQIKFITLNGMGFIDNPFSYVFLNRGHKKQVQILNVELLSTNSNLEDTIKWACKYVCDIINSDSTIEVNLSKKCTDIDFIINELKDVSRNMTKYCCTHNIYYKKKYLFCPMCVDKSIMKNIEVEEIDKSEITKNKSDDQGGEAYIYYHGKDTVFKIFKEEEIDYEFKIMIIAQLLRKRRILKAINQKNLKFKYIIPEKFLIDGETHNISGYSMKRVKGFPISILKDKKEIEDQGLNMKDVLEILITAGEGIETLHKEANIFIGDLNGQNIFFDSNKNVYFLDFDGMGIDDISPRCYTDEYIDPLSEKDNNITMKDDWYSFAVQAFHYLTFVHPFNGLYTTTVNGIEVSYDIVDKMEHRLSLLGNHGIEVPSIAVSWNWMNKELERKFLDIFEGDNRDSIVPYLKNQYEELYGSCGSELLNKVVRVNSMFVAKKIHMFKNPVVKVINHYAAICCNSKNNHFYIAIKVGNNENEKNEYNIDFPYIMDIDNILLSENKEVIWIIYNNKVTSIDLKANTELYTEEISDMRNVVANGNILYFTYTRENENFIFKRNSDKKEEIRFLTKKVTKRFLVRLDNKFVVIKNASNNTDEVYCNSDKLCDIRCTSKDTQYNIIYDDISKSWLVINNDWNGIIINMSNGKHYAFNLPKDVTNNDINLENIYFKKWNIYIPSKNSLYIFNFNNQSYKKMECNEIMTPDSKLYDINSKGFCVITDNVLYDIHRG